MRLHRLFVCTTVSLVVAVGCASSDGSDIFAPPAGYSPGSAASPALPGAGSGTGGASGSTSAPSSSGGVLDDAGGALPEQDAGADASADAATDGGPKQFGQRCGADADCSTGLCRGFLFRKRCTKRCEQATDCPNVLCIEENNEKVCAAF